MPEFPDIELYLSALERRIVGQRIEAARFASPFLVRSIDPPVDVIVGKEVRGLRRLGKRVVWELTPQFTSGKKGLDEQLFAVFHLMIAGRFRWKDRGAPIPGKVGLAAFDFAGGTLILTEAGSKRQASLYLVRGEAALAAHDPGGLEVMTQRRVGVRGRIAPGESHLKRALTDPHLLSGIGNAYSDEILHAAKMSPMRLTQQTERRRVRALVRHHGGDADGVARSADCGSRR